MLPTTAERVRENTADTVNQRIRAETEARIARLAENPGRIGERLQELDREWDIERAIEANASGLALTGIILGAFVHPAILLLPALVTAFLLQHALQGWCPPVPVLRRMGFRTAGEIDQEKYALKHLRGEFAAVPTGTPAERAHQAFTAAEA